MNIEQYRALKEAEKGNPVVVQPQAQEPNQPVTEVIEPTTTSDEIEIEGIGKVKIDELKNGYMRQSDYTKKTQDISSKRKELDEAVKVYDYLKAHPEIAQTMVEKANGSSDVDSINPATSQVRDLEAKLQDLSLQVEIDKLQVKYPDFEVMEVLNIAKDKGIFNLEDAYKLNKASKTNPQEVDVEKLKAELRDQLRKELEAEVLGTRTLVGRGGGTQPVATAELSAQEKKVAKGMRMSEADYMKWRDAT